MAEVSKAFATLQVSCQLTGLQLPQNTGGPDKARRELDCKVIETLHGYRKDHGMPDYDSVRAFFPEDECLYPDAGFRKRNHVQICAFGVQKQRHSMSWVAPFSLTFALVFGIKSCSSTL
ncbi:MAG: hypothetical protein CO105_15640 [Comamonadaceae bacterium CG_4_9_14_3_um_filter_60_33]|nr:MAG: hypothetical protein AUK51_15800 [Comamonadaceae bacterium CG2_30_59_20]PJB40702.1 MAG: hypothetical protein CO105_15640 [Comamonadaceae bacterium CG_4_9_14_3_um_filter_60_33]